MRFRRAKLGGTVVEPILRSVGVSLEGSVQEAERSAIHFASPETQKWVNSRFRDARGLHKTDPSFARNYRINFQLLSEFAVSSGHGATGGVPPSRVAGLRGRVVFICTSRRNSVSFTGLFVGSAASIQGRSLPHGPSSGSRRRSASVPGSYQSPVKRRKKTTPSA